MAVQTPISYNPNPSVWILKTRRVVDLVDANLSFSEEFVALTLMKLNLQLGQCR